MRVSINNGATLFEQLFSTFLNFFFIQLIDSNEPDCLRSLFMGMNFDITLPITRAIKQIFPMCVSDVMQPQSCIVSNSQYHTILLWIIATARSMVSMGIGIEKF